MTDAPLLVVYRRCCKVWPIALGYVVRRCGLCGEVPTEPAAESDRQRAERAEAEVERLRLGDSLYRSAAEEAMDERALADRLAGALRKRRSMEWSEECKSALAAYDAARQPITITRSCPEGRTPHTEEWAGHTMYACGCPFGPEPITTVTSTGDAE